MKMKLKHFSPTEPNSPSVCRWKHLSTFLHCSVIGYTTWQSMYRISAYTHTLRKKDIRCQGQNKHQMTTWLVSYNNYFHNHRVLSHGNLMGMVHFHCSVSWSKIKHMKGEYFQWLHRQKVFLNQTKFKTDTLVACGFFLGAHPGHLHWDEAEQELQEWLQLDQDMLFQLSSRTVTVPIDHGKHEWYSF